MPCHTLQFRQLYPTYLFEEMTGKILENLQYILLVGKRHLTVYLCELRLTVSTQVLITEALGNLEIAVETTDHQQLLQGLRTLRQCIELSRVHTTGHYEVTGTLWSATYQDRCLHLDEVQVIQEVTDKDGHTVT